ncbi:PucR family transcriptional regulator [Amycolatopsis endophytica]
MLGMASVGSDASPRAGTVAGTSQARRLWFSLPAELARRFRPHADRLATKILDEIQHTVPEYAKPLEGQFGEVIVRAIEQAVLSCLDSIEDLQAAQDRWGKMFHEVGKRVYHDGGSLNSLQAAYRAGGQAAWRYVSGFGQSMRLPVPMLCVSAEAIFAYVDEISSYSVEGYTLAQARATGTLERRRHRLLELILATPPSSPSAVSSMARAAQWDVPEWVTVVALEPLEEQHFVPPLSEDVLLDLEGAEPCLITPVPARDIPVLESEMPNWRAAVGPRVRLTDAATSLYWARRTLELVRAGLISGGPVVHSSDHLTTLWLLQDRFLLEELSSRTLAPFASLTPKQQLRLAETLLAWLKCNGNTVDIARLLDIHPQTVRYRVSQLTELFGDRLGEPEERLTMQIALEAHHLLGTRPS